jgi:hypothetical protein
MNATRCRSGWWGQVIIPRWVISMTFWGPLLPMGLSEGSAPSAVLLGVLEKKFRHCSDGVLRFLQGTNPPSMVLAHRRGVYVPFCVCVWGGGWAGGEVSVWRVFCIYFRCWKGVNKMHVLQVFHRPAST